MRRGEGVLTRRRSLGLLACAVVVATGLCGCGEVATTATRSAMPSHPPVLASTVAAPTRAAPPARAVLASPAVFVKPLTALVLPDLLITAPTALTAAQVAGVHAVIGVTSVLPLAAGRLSLPRGSVEALGVDPSTFRTFTPARTASSDALWASVARGEVLTTFDVAKAQAEKLGATVRANGQLVRLGSFADLQMPGVGAVVTTATGRVLGLTDGAGLIVTAPSRDVVGLRTEIARMLPDATIEMLRPVLPSGHATMSKALYVAAAATCPGLPWSVLAAIGGIESDHGADAGVSSAGAEGPMQFLPATFAEVATDGDGDGKALIDDPADAVYSAAKLLCRDGVADGQAGLRTAVFDYNHAGWYVDAVLELAAIYARED